MRKITHPFGLLAVASLGALFLLVAGAGAIAVWASLNDTWRHFFLMEQTFATLTPIVLGVAAVAVITSLAAILRSGSRND
ncbi:hypothetical protein ACFOZ7_08285 [Natribaculum luteum]|uniref:Cox cluster protein n=1 Tax=Natribaculum luteum TaxID=1586232 RepID=A0ABD5NY35_9EURY|nr:hypothetical protein [Natribaculum luteum]